MKRIDLGLEVTKIQRIDVDGQIRGSPLAASQSAGANMIEKSLPSVSIRLLDTRRVKVI